MCMELVCCEVAFLNQNCLTSLYILGTHDSSSASSNVSCLLLYDRGFYILKTSFFFQTSSSSNKSNGKKDIPIPRSKDVLPLGPSYIRCGAISPKPIKKKRG